MSSQTDILRKLIKTTEKSAVAAQKLAGEFMTKGREQAESVMSMVESEVEKQLARIGFATMAELGKLEARIDALTSKASASVASKTVAAKTVAAKTVAAKTVAAQPVAAKPVVKKTVSAKPVVKKTVATKAPAAKAPVAKKAAAKVAAK